MQPAGGPKRAFGAVLRDARRFSGLSQEQLAEAAGLDRSFISLVERGIHSPNVVVLLAVAKALNIPAAELVARTEETLRLEAKEASSPTPHHPA